MLAEFQGENVLKLCFVLFAHLVSDSLTLVKDY